MKTDFTMDEIKNLFEEEERKELSKTKVRKKLREHNIPFQEIYEDIISYSDEIMYIHSRNGILLIPFYETDVTLYTKKAAFQMITPQIEKYLQVRLEDKKKEVEQLEYILKTQRLRGLFS